jgi:imidazolonepropionase-like amidohydrolase
LDDLVPDSAEHQFAHRVKGQFSHDIGRVAAGKSADFIIHDANPLENIATTRRINKVYLR